MGETRSTDWNYIVEIHRIILLIQAYIRQYLTGISTTRKYLMKCNFYFWQMKVQKAI